VILAQIIYLVSYLSKIIGGRVHCLLRSELLWSLSFFAPQTSWCCNTHHLTTAILALDGCLLSTWLNKALPHRYPATVLLLEGAVLWLWVGRVLLLKAVAVINCGLLRGRMLEVEDASVT
jgi:hypothetical protein